MEERQRHISPEHEYEEHIYDRRGEKSKDKYLKKTMEMLNHHGQYETENTEDWVETKTHHKQYKFPEDNFMGSGELGNLQQDPQCKDKKNYPETEEDMKNKAEEANQVKGRIIKNSRFTKKYPVLYSN